MRCSDCSSAAAAVRARFDRQRDLVRRVARLARVHARFFARFEQRPALAVECCRRCSRSPMCAMALSSRLRASRACSRSPSSLAVELLEFGGDTVQALLRAVDATAMALQLTGEFGEPAMRGVQLALRVVAHAFGVDARLLAVIERVDVRRRSRFRAASMRAPEFADFALACEHADLRAAAAQHARKAAAEPFARGVITDCAGGQRVGVHALRPASRRSAPARAARARRPGHRRAPPANRRRSRSTCRPRRSA